VDDLVAGVAVANLASSGEFRRGVEAGVANENRRRWPGVVGILVIVVGIVAVCAVGWRDGQSRRAKEAVVTGSWDGEWRAAYLGRDANGVSTWRTVGERQWVEVLMWVDQAKGETMVQVIVSDPGKWEEKVAKTRWHGDGEYEAERSNFVGGGRMAVKIRVTVPKVDD